MAKQKPPKGKGKGSKTGQLVSNVWMPTKKKGQGK